jgi:hypothetical protein
MKTLYIDVDTWIEKDFVEKLRARILRLECHVALVYNHANKREVMVEVLELPQIQGCISI